jgi:hypothetical protein
MPGLGVQTSWTFFVQGWSGAGLLEPTVGDGVEILSAGTGGQITP